MIECLFTIDYEIYGNGEGSLREQIYEPARRLVEIFDEANARFVAFVEVSELEIIEAQGSDEGIHDVKRQVRDFHSRGYEVAMHLHPQWYQARFEKGRWLLNYDDYNLCTLPRERIESIVTRAIDYFRIMLGERDFVPFTFRAGNWLFQPSKVAAEVMAERGIKIDSSVFKGGLQRRQQLDYRPSLGNGYFWRFDDDANVATPQGRLLEIPTFTLMVPFWKMLTGKRVGLQKKSPSTAQTNSERLSRYVDYLRPRYPLKFDFCRMTLEEMVDMIEREWAADERAPEQYRPLVAIGHTKDLEDFASIEAFLSYLRAKRIKIVTFPEVYDRCIEQLGARRQPVHA